MNYTADLSCDPDASSCELFQVTWEPPCHLGFKCSGSKGDLQFVLGPGYCIGLIAEGLLAGVNSLFSEDADHSVDFPLPGTDRTAFFSRIYERDIDGVVLRILRLSRHKRGQEVWITITGPYGLSIQLSTTIEQAQQFVAQLQPIVMQIPGSLQSSSEEWAIEEASAILAGDAQKRQKAAALNHLINLSASSDSIVASWAIEALGKAKGRAVEAALKRAIAHPDAFVRCSGAEALGHAAGSRAATPLKKLLLDEDPSARLGAVRGLGASLGAGATQVLLKAQKKERDGRVKATIAGLLLTHGHQDSRFVLAELLTSADSSARAFAKSELRRAGITPGWREEHKGS